MVNKYLRTYLSYLPRYLDTYLNRYLSSAPRSPSLPPFLPPYPLRYLTYIHTYIARSENSLPFPPRPSPSPSPSLPSPNKQTNHPTIFPARWQRSLSQTWLLARLVSSRFRCLLVFLVFISLSGAEGRGGGFEERKKKRKKMIGFSEMNGILFYLSILSILIPLPISLPIVS